MRISEIIQLNEGPELKSTLKSLSTILGTPINQLYLMLSKNAEDNAVKGMTLKQNNFLAAGVKARWVDQFISGLKGELHSLAKQIPPKSAVELKKFLMTTPSKFKHFEIHLPEILIQIGKSRGFEDLASLGRNWDARKNQYHTLLQNLDFDDGEGTDLRSEPTTPKANPEKDKQRSAAAQNTAADQMIAHVLNNVPQNIRHEIRTKIQKTPIENRLQVLAQLLQSKGIKI